MMLRKKLYVSLYLIIVLGLAGGCYFIIGKDMLPKVNNGQFQIRLKAPQGTRLEQTEIKLKQVLAIVDSTVQEHLGISSAYVGLVPSSYGVSNLYVFNSGTNEAVLQVDLYEEYKINLDELKDVLRKNIAYTLPDVKVTFEPIEMTEKIMSQGASAPIEVRIAGKDMEQIGLYAGKLEEKMKTIPYLRDVQINQPLKFPAIQITLDRTRIAQLGINVKDVAGSITAATSSSRFTEKNLWLDEKAAYTYQVQVQVPEYAMNSMDELKEIPLMRGKSRPVLSDIADFKVIYQPGEYDRAGPRRFVTVSANIHKKDLGTATAEVRKSIASIGAPPKGLLAEVKGMSSLLDETMSSLQSGLLFAITVIFLLLAANYQSFKVSMSVLATIPAVILGSLLALMLTGSTLNLQSYMGMIMSTGVSVANAILIITNAEKLRLDYADSSRAAVTSASIRLRPILMTTFAMIAGMLPMASGMGEAGEQTAPLGRAVIGGLIASTFAALFILPLVFAWAQKKASLKDVSLMPEETNHITQ